MRLGKKTSGTTSASLIAFASDDLVPAHGYFLWCNTSLNVSLNCDGSNNGTVANNNSIALINGSLAGGTVVDAVTFGTPGTTFGEGTSLTAPVASSSVERKAKSTSTSLSMAVGGGDEFAGNGEDTDNNASDFVTRATPQPQNSLSTIEIPIIPTPSPTLTPTEIPTITPTETPTPTLTPTTEPTATPTIEPSPTPTAEPTPTLSPTLSPTPTLEPIITPSASPSPTPSISPAPTPRIIARGPNFTCSLNYNLLRIMGLKIWLPSVKCMRI